MENLSEVPSQAKSQKEWGFSLIVQSFYAMEYKLCLRVVLT